MSIAAQSLNILIAGHVASLEVKRFLKHVAGTAPAFFGVSDATASDEAKASREPEIPLPGVLCVPNAEYSRGAAYHREPPLMRRDMIRFAINLFSVAAFLEALFPVAAIASANAGGVFGSPAAGADAFAKGHHSHADSVHVLSRQNAPEPAARARRPAFRPSRAQPGDVGRPPGAD